MKKFYYYLLSSLFILGVSATLVLACGDDNGSEGDDDDNDSQKDDDDNDDDDNDDNGGGGKLPTGGFSGVDNGDGTITDKTTGLMWAKELKGSYQDTPHGEAAPYCEALELGGHTDWRLPTIEEMRSLIVGCEATMLGGACNVYGPCASDEQTCMANCQGCDLIAGPGEGGYYLDDIFGGKSKSMYSGSWSSTEVGYSAGMVFTVDWRNASVGAASTVGKFNVRCVRKP